MGGDGGVVANNRRFLPQAYMAEVKDKEERLAEDVERWVKCKYSKMTLRPPILADELGNLYSGENVFRALQLKEEIAPHVRGMRDLVTLKLEVNEAKKEVHAALCAGNDDGSVEDYLDVYQCPITLQTTNGKNKFCYARECAHVFSQRALHQMGSDECPVCGAPATANWEEVEKKNLIVPLAPPKDVAEELGQKLKKRRALQKAEKKRRAEDGGEGEGEKPEKPKKKKKKKDDEEGAAPRVVTSTKVATTLSKDKAPEGATDEVWKSIFRKDIKKYDGVGEGFLTRSGMFGPAYRST